MKKFLALVLSLALVIALVACGGGGGAKEPAAGDSASAESSGGGTDSGAKTAANVKIVLLLPGEINDQGWNASNYAGVVACNEQLGTSMENVEAVP